MTWHLHPEYIKNSNSKTKHRIIKTQANNLTKKMLNTNHQGTVKQNHNETTSHPSQNSYHPKTKNNCGRGSIEWGLSHIIGGNSIPTAIMETTICRFIIKLEIELHRVQQFKKKQNQYIEEIAVPSCFLQHYSQQPSYRIILGAHEQVNG